MQDSGKPSSQQPGSPHSSYKYNKNERPKNLNLLSIKLPMSAVMSIGHRAAGILLFLSLPYFLYLLQLSLTDQAGFALAKVAIQGPVMKLLGLLVLWSLAHHFFAGIRYLLLDLDIGIEKQSAQKSAVLVMIAGFLVFVAFSIILL